MKILLCRGSPRCDIQKVEDYNKIIPYDRLICEYTPEFQAYQKMREFFLSKDYDYMVLATDDIVVTPKDIEILQKDLECGEYKVLSGLMNVDEIDYFKPDGRVNVCIELALKDKKCRHYNWLTYNTLPEKEIFQVKFAGFGLTAIHRSIIEKYIFAGDAIFKGKGMEFGASLDFVFCWYCHENNIPIFVDKRISMQHLRTSGNFHIGELKQNLVFWPKGEEIQRV